MDRLRGDLRGRYAGMLQKGMPEGWNRKCSFALLYQTTAPNICGPRLTVLVDFIGTDDRKM